MSRSRNLRDDAERIWRAGVEAVRPETLLPASVRVDGNWLLVDNGGADLVEVDLHTVRRLFVVGAGKAGAGMARGLEAALGEAVLTDKRLAGLVSVPADCLGPTRAIELVAGRPAGVNEPRPEGVAATQRILKLLGSATADDLCLVLLSGGGSALLCAPADGVTLDQKAAVTRLLSGAGATIEQLNTVRKQISQVKGGGLLRACRAGRMVSLVLSDVLGDPLDMIASGPTVPNPQTRDDALRVLAELGVERDPAAAPIVAHLRNHADARPIPPRHETRTVVIGNNATAVDAAGIEAERLGYNHAMTSSRASEGPAEEIGRGLAEEALRMRDEPPTSVAPDCLITGGEPTVTLADAAIRGLGGRNQQLTLAALQEMRRRDRGDLAGVCLLSGGTDGEDGPTDAAGAVIDTAVAARAESAGLDLEDALRRNDAYRFFEAADGLLLTGPTGTNVCDLRVVTVDRGGS
ncbi:glycerate kinase type-2 family protein [Pseudobythopirellula maris]|nr:DUF4147 domain-containing protein [Pseudobythopirellula maris]